MYAPFTRKNFFFGNVETIKLILLTGNYMINFIKLLDFHFRRKPFEIGFDKMKKKM